MKHIRKKFMFEIEGEIDTSDPSFIQFEDLQLIEKTEIRKLQGTKAVLQLEDKVVYGILCKIKSNHVIIPIPDFTLIYFDQAQARLKLIENKKTELINKIGCKKNFDETDIGEIYSFFGLVSGFVIYLFTSIESFINHQIPKGKSYIVKKPKKTESYDFNQIQFLSFDVKCKEVLPYFTNKNYFQRQTKNTQHIDELKKFRNSIVHTKFSEELVDYHDLIKKAITFNCLNKIKAVSNYMNFYRPGYIKECDCGKDI